MSFTKFETIINQVLQKRASVKVGLAELSIDKEVVELSQEDIETLILHLKEKIKVVSINTRLCAIKAFFNYLDKNKLINSNPMKNIKQLRDRQKIMETLDDEVIVEVAKHKKSRDYAIFLIMIDNWGKTFGVGRNQAR
ncbi:hypothetical protein V7087_14650 [Neobacillus niacini]|uniref:hypothetical protein n=1 Tax=Neobacillus niacini TaxID=86668 RepID=UPI002FFE46D8